MTIPCEQMQAIPGEQTGWLAWGTQAPSGEFMPLYGLEASLSTREAMYELDAAGVCDIQGKRAQGQGIPDEQPRPIPEMPTNPEPAAVEVQPAPAAAPAVTPWWQGKTVVGSTVLVVGVLMILGAKWTDARRKRTDSTPPPRYEDNPFGGAE